MKKMLISLLFIVAIASCKKEEKPMSKTYNIEYKILATPLANSSVIGTVSYISKTSVTSTGSVTNSGWNVAENNWNLNVGDKVGFTASVGNFADYQASITVDGVIRAFQLGAQTVPITTKLNLSYTIE
jgi:hypothetical protein